MTIPTPTRLVDGAVAEFDDVLTLFNSYRTWINAVPIADLELGAVQTEHIVRPTIDGFPRNAFRGQRQIVQHATFGSPGGAGKEAVATRPRLTIPVGDLRSIADQPVWLLPLGFRATFPSQADVTVVASFGWSIRCIENTGGAPTYPNTGSGTPTEAGYFSLWTKRRYNVSGNSTDGDPTEQVETRNQVLPVGVGGVTYGDRGSFLWSNQCAAGTWDLYLGYSPPTAGVTGLLQIDGISFSATLEALL